MSTWFSKDDAFTDKSSNNIPAVTENAHEEKQRLTSDCENDKGDTEFVVEDEGIWVMSINQMPYGYVEEKSINNSLWEAARDEQNRFITSGEYSHVYLEPVDDYRIDVVGARAFYVISYDRILSSVTCDFVKDLTSNKKKN